MRHQKEKISSEVKRKKSISSPNTTDPNLPSQAIVRMPSKSIKIDFLSSHGGNPAEWILRQSNISIFINPRAIEAYFGFFPYGRISPTMGTNGWWNNLLKTWKDFQQAIKINFGPTDYDDLQRSLAKLTQTSSVFEYQTQFEALSDRVYGLLASLLKNCFISGLKTVIRRDFIARQPFTIHHAIGLARLQEERLHDVHAVAKSNSSPFLAPSSQQV